jgi:hypothetical protein
MKFHTITPAQLEALAHFAKRYGVAWKQALIDKWVQRTAHLEPAGEYLLELQNTLGGYGLFQYQLPFNHR